MKQLKQKYWIKNVWINWTRFIVIYFMMIVEINTIQSVTINSSFQIMNVLQINAFTYSSVANDLVYCTFYDSGRNLHVFRKYNLTLLLQNSAVAPIYQVILSNQATSYNRLLQINGTHIICYSTNINNLQYQVFGLLGNPVGYQSTPDHINQFIFIKRTSEIYILYDLGYIEVMSLNTFLGLDAGNVQALFQIFFSQIIQGFVSPNQMYMAIKISIYEQVHILNLDTLNFIDQFYFISVGSIAWNSRGDTFYVWDDFVAGVYQKNMSIISGPIFYPTYTSVSYNVFEFIYINDTNQLLLIGYPLSPTPNPKRLEIISYNFINLTILYTIQYVGNMKNIVIYQSIDQSKINFAIWFQSPYALVYLGQIVVFYNSVVNNSIVNVTNNTFLNNNNSNISNNSIVINPRIYSYEDTQLGNIFKNYLDNSISNNPVVNTLNKVPGSRKYLKPIFSFFTNFDDLWLYIYHSKNYNSAINQMFQSIQILQKEKWQKINIKSLLWGNVFKVNLEQLESYFNTQLGKILTFGKFYQIQGNSNGFFLNMIDFYTSNFILIIVTYIIGRLVFIFLKKIKTSLKQCFISFKFTLFLFLVIFEGNIQWMIYLFGFDMKTLAYNSSWKKFEEVLVLLLNFFNISFVVSLYFIIKYEYNKQSIRLYDNFQNVRYGCFYLTMQWGIRNLVLGMIHIFFQQQNLRNLMLIILQLFFMSISLALISEKSRKYFHRKIFQHKSTIWITIFATMMRVILVGTFFINYQEGQQSQLVDINISSVILIVYIFLWQVSMMLELGYFLSQLKQIFKIGSSQVEKNLQKPINKSKSLIEKTILQQVTNTRHSQPTSKGNQIHKILIQDQILSQSNIKKPQKIQVITLDSRIRYNLKF